MAAAVTPPQRGPGPQEHRRASVGSLLLVLHRRTLLRRSRSLGRWSGIFFMKEEMEERKESMLKSELNTTTSETRLQHRNTGTEPGLTIDLTQD
ncbi:hypothetical protein EYF80_020166 [Liparis tanakae]|uniref:Uncharacterized protein n=1 Tax=Liparis tanakae TaxID=230148 RepID=A0A4Z2HV70_9TELE|nr:hypothetical protein EYF80_020166 [Liparis tanakae]